VRVTNLLIVACVAVGIGFGAYFLGHAVDGPAKQLDTVVSEPRQAAAATAQANLGVAISAASSYKIDHGSYAGMTTNALRGYDRGLASSVFVKQASAGAYCLESTVAGATASVRGPNSTFVAHRC
jgi:hypothetical protein